MSDTESKTFYDYCPFCPGQCAGHTRIYGRFAGDEKAIAVTEKPIKRVGDALFDDTTEMVTDPNTGGAKGVKIARYDLIPVRPLAEVAALYGKGARKYEERNWERGYKWSSSYGALQRHAQRFWAGEAIDPETGLSHMAAVVFHSLALMQFTAEHPELDDRPSGN